MKNTVRQLAIAAVIASGLISARAQNSVVIDFDDPALEATIYGSTETFSQKGFLMTQLYDGGLVGTNFDVGSAAPVGDATQYYSNYNNGALLITLANGGTFTLQSFDLAFIPLTSASDSEQGDYLGVISYDALGNGNFPIIFPFAASTSSGYPFETWNDPSIAAAYSNVSALEFFTCTVDSSNNCVDPQNNGQFALDNVTLSVPLSVPEPTTTAMMAVGLIGLIGQRIRSRARGRPDGHPSRV